MSYHETSIHRSSIQSSPNIIGVRDAKKIENEGRMSFEKNFPKNEVAVFLFGVLLVDCSLFPFCE
jgi:hypothetical protein